MRRIHHKPIVEEMRVLGKVIRAKRIEMGKSLRCVAQRTGLTPSFLSQVERGLAEPSVASLRKIAEALGVPIFYLFLNSNGVEPVVRKENCRHIVFPASTVSSQVLTPDARRKMGVTRVCIAPGGESSPEPVTHPGEEFIHVIGGRMLLALGDLEYQMETGDSIYYYSSIPHRICNIGQDDLIVISAVTPPNF